MAKDPAFLFYHQDFFTGVSDMSNEAVGAYVRCLCIQASKGGITEKHMKNICITHEVHNEIKIKFVFDAAAGLFKNPRLEFEIDKRKKYSESRANNRKTKSKDKKDMKNISKTYVKHMENEIENENVIDKEKESAREKTESVKTFIEKKVGPLEAKFADAFQEEILADAEWISRTTEALGQTEAVLKLRVRQFVKIQRSKEKLYPAAQAVKEHFVNTELKNKNDAGTNINNGDITDYSKVPGKDRISKTHEGFSNIAGGAKKSG